ncbi:transcriptional regulator with XRE-family HTH domain [Streptomyces sp. SPB162]|nr:transcriptional regulator with XRE-family HTH domain [Streptomyces sp. SPB162]
MPPRINPTARQVRLGTELRKLREAAGVTARETAARLSASHTQVSHIESGRFGISEGRLRTLAAFYVCDDADLVDALAAMANERGKGWWEGYRGVLVPQALDLAELEHHATSLRTLQVLHIPGILQTEDRVRAAFAYVNPDLPGDELEAEVTHRIRRREVIEGEGAPAFEAVVHEAALRIKVGGAKSSRAQLEHILALSERDNVTVRVIPFDVGRLRRRGVLHALRGRCGPATGHGPTRHGPWQHLPRCGSPVEEVPQPLRPHQSRVPLR